MAPVLLLLILLIALVVWRVNARRDQLAHRRPPRQRTRPRARFVPPDDDPEFLRRLGKRRHDQDNPD